MSELSLRLTEIFHSLQGESTWVGLPTVFVRLTGCPLRCSYCDTAYAFEGGKQHTLPAILETVRAYQPQSVCVTGGEPLAQPNCLPLLSQLCDEYAQVSLETSGAMPVKEVDVRVKKVLDLKTPSSNEMARNLYENVDYLTQHDEVKFVIGSRQDYEWACFKVDEYQLTERAGTVLFSPSHGQVEPQQLADWIVQDKAPVRFQMQLHKILWGDKPGV